MGGHVEAVKVLLAKGASVKAVDSVFAATPLERACEGWRHTSQNGADHVEMAGLLLAAGSPREWVAREKAPNPEGTQDRLSELCRAAEAP
jgi:hypothetical protein